MKDLKDWKKTHTNKILVDNWKPLDRISQKSVLHKVQELKEKHHLPETREPLLRVPGSLPPYLPLKGATINTKLIGNCSKKSDPLILKTSALETIDSYPKDWIHTYTDGSAFKATINAGYGATVNYPDG